MLVILPGSAERVLAATSPVARVRINVPSITARVAIASTMSGSPSLASAPLLLRSVAPAWTPSQAPAIKKEVSVAQAAMVAPAASPDRPNLSAPLPGAPAGAPETARGAAEDIVSVLGPDASEPQRRARLDAFFSGSSLRPELAVAVPAPHDGPAAPRLRKSPDFSRPRAASRPIGSPGAQAGRAAVPALGSLLGVAGLAALAGAAGTAVLAPAFSVASVALALGGGYIFIIGGLLDRKEEGWAAVLALPYLGAAAYAAIKTGDVLLPIFERLVSLSDLALIGAAAVLPLAFAAARRLASRIPRDSDGIWVLGAALFGVGVVLGAAGAVNAALGLLPSTRALEALGPAMAAAVASGWAVLTRPDAWVAAAATPGAWAASATAGALGFLIGSVPWGKAGHGGRFDGPAGLAWGLSAAFVAAGAWITVFGAGGAAAWIMIAGGLLKPALAAAAAVKVLRGERRR
ncbi:MAG: hypothetical protein AAB320_02480 [Elusimicrobiota bacterium]